MISIPQHRKLPCANLHSVLVNLSTKQEDDSPLPEGMRDIQYSFTTDSNSLFWIRQKTRIFNFPERMIDKSKSRSHAKQFKHSYEKTSRATREVAAELGLGGDYQSLSLAAKRSFNNKVGKKRKTLMIEDYYESTKLSYYLKPEDYSQFLLPKVKRDFMNLPPEKIVKKYGEYYATSLDKGGILKASVKIVMTERSDESKLVQQYEAKYKYGPEGFLRSIGLKKDKKPEDPAKDPNEPKKSTEPENNTVQASFSHTFESMELDECHQMDTEVEVYGGNSDLWLKTGPRQEIQDKWAESVTEDNYFIVGYQMDPIWDLISDVSPEKGKKNHSTFYCGPY